MLYFLWGRQTADRPFTSCTGFIPYTSFPRDILINCISWLIHFCFISFHFRERFSCALGRQAAQDTIPRGKVVEPSGCSRKPTWKHEDPADSTHKESADQTATFCRGDGRQSLWMRNLCCHLMSSSSLLLKAARMGLRPNSSANYSTSVSHQYGSCRLRGSPLPWSIADVFN